MAWTPSLRKTWYIVLNDPLLTKYHVIGIFSSQQLSGSDSSVVDQGKGMSATLGWGLGMGTLPKIVCISGLDTGRAAFAALDQEGVARPVEHSDLLRLF